LAGKQLSLEQQTNVLRLWLAFCVLLEQPIADGLPTMMKRLFVVVCLLLAAGNRTGVAQPTNLEGFQQMAWQCLGGGLPDTVRAFRLDAPSEMPYVRSALVQRWRGEQRSPFVADSATRPDLARLAYVVDEAAVTYENAPDDRLPRSQRLALRYTLTAPDGELLIDRRCRETRADTVASARRDALEDEAFPRTQAEPPPAGGWRRYVKPALLVAATAVGVYLFFSIRSSDRAESL
jgi:hypothetical protein